MASIYILHFNKPYWHNAKHYVGYTKFTAEERIAKHRNGNGSLLVSYALKHRCDFELSHDETFDTTQEARYRERQLKREGHLSRHCSICSNTKLHKLKERD